MLPGGNEGTTSALSAMEKKRKLIFVLNGRIRGFVSDAQLFAQRRGKNS